MYNLSKHWYIQDLVNLPIKLDSAEIIGKLGTGVASVWNREDNGNIRACRLPCPGYYQLAFNMGSVTFSWSASEKRQRERERERETCKISARHDGWKEREWRGSGVQYKFNPVLCVCLTAQSCTDAKKNPTRTTFPSPIILCSFRKIFIIPMPIGLL